MEAESLECILMDDLEVLSATIPRQYKVRVLPYVNGEGENHVGVQASFSIPPTYPDVPAEISVEAEKGLSSGQCEALERVVAEKAVENVGMPMVYLLVDAIREWLVEHNVAGDKHGSMHAEMLKRMHLKEKVKQREDEAQARATAGSAGALNEEDELMRQKRLEGTPVTPESFLEWRAVFEAEMEAVALKKTGGVKAAAVKGDGPEKPSGKEMFLRNLAGTAEEDEEAAQADEAEEALAKERVEVNAALYDDDEDDSDFELDSDEESDYSGESDESDD